jgi:putative Holliday junction resolvase
MPRILSIDYGQKRTGIAVTDEMKIIASGLTIPSATAVS